MKIVPPNHCSLENSHFLYGHWSHPGKRQNTQMHIFRILSRDSKKAGNVNCFLAHARKHPSEPSLLQPKAAKRQQSLGRTLTQRRSVGPLWVSPHLPKGWVPEPKLCLDNIPRTSQFSQELASQGPFFACLPAHFTPTLNDPPQRWLAYMKEASWLDHQAFAGELPPQAWLQEPAPIFLLWAKYLDVWIFLFYFTFYLCLFWNPQKSRL